MPNYNNTVIYKIINYDLPEFVYVGHTTNFTKRKQHHKEGTYSETSPKYNRLVYKTIRENGVWGDWKMIIIKEFPCENRRQAEAEEDKYMMELKCTLNTIRASRNQKQYRIDNKERLKEYGLEYRENNKDAANERSKEWYKNNTEMKKEYDKQYKKDNSEKIKARKSKTFTCECGNIVCHNHRSRHIQTKKHIKCLNV